MSQYLLLYLITVLSIGVDQSTANISYRNFVYQKDMSEYCRRRVIPAVFLGRQVVDANSQILHFSRLNMPYSCFITVRSEIGSNIIVVIQVLADVDLQKSCKKGDHHLVIYEMGETFGGYWGQMPDSVMRQGRRRDDNTYILKSSTAGRPPTTTKRTTTTSTTEATTTPTESSDESEDDRNEGYLSVEIPILNVSARIVPGKLELNSSFSTEDTFDSVYDVTRHTDEVSYDTKVVPLLEIGVHEMNVGGREKTDEGESVAEFQMELNDLFTPDPRLLLNDVPEVTYKKKTYKYNPSVNRLLDFKKNKNHFIANRPIYWERPASTERPQLKTVQPNNYVSKLYDVKQDSIDANGENVTESNSHYWDAIHAILKNISKDSDVSTEPPHEELAKILSRISDKELNKSLYLNPSLSYIDLHTPVVPLTVQSSTTTGQSGEYRTHFNQLNDMTKNISVPQEGNKSNNKSNSSMNNNSAVNNKNAATATLALLPLALDVDSVILNVTSQLHNGVQEKQLNKVLELNSTRNITKSDSKPVSLVDHESFENIVQSASVMAIKLNQTETTTTSHSTQGRYVTKRKRSNSRKKRFLHAIDIEGAQPHHVQDKKHVTTTKKPEKFDVRDLQRLVELQDDEIHGRVALRYLPQYLGPPLLDFCDFNATTTKYVYLFNSSRLVLALSNFTLKSMTVVMTPARSLLDSETQCGSTYLECQVAGARVCIDSLCACDGVPNCGSFDVYDEDRISCGVSRFHHNVCLAAITFLAVLLTVLYITHYWLKRCIPKVSEAFFIYTDAAENVLYLDSIMRSPHEMGIGKDYLSGVQELFAYGEKPKEQNTCSKFIDRCLVFLRCKKTPEAEVVTADLDQLDSGKTSAFTEMEIKKLTSSMTYSSDAAVQTGSSLQEESLTFSPIYSKDQNLNLVDTSTECIGTQSTQHDSISNQSSDELSMLQFLRKVKARSASLQQTTSKINFPELSYKPQTSSVKYASNDQGTSREVNELNQYTTDEKVIMEQAQVSKKPSIIIDKIDSKQAAVKHLRFQDEAFVIPHKDEADDAVVGARAPTRRSIVFGAGRVFHIQDPEDETREEEQTAATGRELKSYFNWGKEKNKKKPKRK